MGIRAVPGREAYPGDRAVTHDAMRNGGRITQSMGQRVAPTVPDRVKSLYVV